MKGVFPRLMAGIAITALLGVSAIPVSAATVPGPTLDVSNPSAGHFLRRGRHMIHGVACDKSATSGTGVDSVTVFKGDRDTGGKFLGAATLGLRTTGTACKGVAGAGWRLKSASLKKGSFTLFVYAHSVSGGETVLQIPIRVDKP